MADLHKISRNQQGGSKEEFFKMKRAAGLIKFQKQAILSHCSGGTWTLELEEEALENDRTIETCRGGRRTAILRLGHMTGAAKILKQTL